MQGIFINYRREDTEGYAITLQDRLAKHFGEKQLFMDVDNIEPGLDFMETIEKSLSSCEVVLVLIGARWLDATDEQGNRRLDNPHDPLRIEIETALNSNARVIPVLLHGTAMPGSDSLPASLAPLTRRHAIEISSSRRDYDLERLLNTLEKIPGLEPITRSSDTITQPAVASDTVTTSPAPRSNAVKHGFVGAGATILLLITLALFNSEETPGLNPDLTPSASALTPDNSTIADVDKIQTASQAITPAQNVAQPQVANVNLSGTWFDDGGTRFEATQKGNRFIAAGFNLFGMATKQIHGTVQGNTLTFTLQDGFVETDGSGTLNADGEHFDYTLTQGNFSETGQLHLNHTRN